MWRPRGMVSSTVGAASAASPASILRPTRRRSRGRSKGSSRRNTWTAKRSGAPIDSRSTRSPPPRRRSRTPASRVAGRIVSASASRSRRGSGASRPFDKERDGFVLSEGSAVLVLEERERALARKAKIYGELIGYGATADAYHITSPSPEGEGNARAMKMALDQAGMKPSDIDYINAHGTSTQPNDREETAAIKRVFGDHAYKLMVSSTKSMTGHLLGAAGALEAMACVLAMRDGCVPPTINYETPDPALDLDYVPNDARPRPIKTSLSNSMGFGGHNASLIFRAA